MVSLFLSMVLAASQPAPFLLVNGTGATLSKLSIRMVKGVQPLGPGRLSPGARGSVPAVGGDRCAYDIMADDNGTALRWSDVNLCDAKTVTLNRRPDGTLWADYE